uniref:Uncharacterized protein n=3 Tax=Cercopithecinae TaxID=9528 RepID=A0A2K5XNH8_MANLE|nr:unnamed protein product [Macaca fascicularis]
MWPVHIQNKQPPTVLRFQDHVPIVLHHHTLLWILRAFRSFFSIVPFKSKCPRERVTAAKSLE